MTQPITLPDAPPIPGLAFRPFRDDLDYAVICGLINAGRIADQNDHLFTTEKVANSFAHTPGFDKFTDVLIAEIDGKPVASTRVWWAVNTLGERIHFTLGSVLPEWRGRGIGTAMLHHNHRRLREIASANPGQGPRFFDTWGADTETHFSRMMDRAGYKPLTYYNYMVRPSLADIPDAPLPPGIEVRPVQPEHMRAIWDADEEAFADHPGHIATGEEGYQRFLAETMFDPSLWRVAWDGDQIAGQVRSFINAQENTDLNRARGYTEYICTRRPWRGKGIARALIALSLAAIRDRGMTEAALSVLTENPHNALQLYLSVGFKVTRTFTVFRLPMD